MKEQTWQRKEYETWDEAFRGLAPAVRQQSVRVADYTHALFVQACADKFAASTPEGQARIRGQYADLAYKCGLYHDLGKALVPPEYQILQKDFTQEELAVYRKYTTDGRALVANLQERSTRARDKRRGELTELPTENIPWLMIRESCQQHMERWDGTGYPDGRKGEEISPIAQIVGLAKELDRLSAETKSETPFEDALAKLRAGSGKDWSAELIKVLDKAETACAEIYKKYIHYTMTLPKTVPLLEKKPDRPMGLQFRPMTTGEKLAGFEAIPWFGGIAGRPGEREEAEDVEELLKRTDLTKDVTEYFLYEATDALVRFANCKLDAVILLRILPDFYQQSSQLAMLEKVFSDQGLTKDKLLLTVPESAILNATKGRQEILQRYLRNGLRMVLDGFHPGAVSPETLAEYGFTLVHFAPDLVMQPETAEAIKDLRSRGITVLGGGADSHEILEWLGNCGCLLCSGTVTGALCGEDDMIRLALAREQE